ncbi:major facilitator superfamily domain-containing protein [Phthorimaea operculella]|nr:major facilitator superfamily domain-containing protein [Phthorimaea operculella]
MPVRQASGDGDGSGHGSRVRSEQGDSSSNYKVKMGLKPDEDKRPSKLAIMDEEDSNIPSGLGQRHWVTFMLFLGMANAYVMRTNMSVAIVAMVNHTALPVFHEETLDDECGTANVTSSVAAQDGPFVWSSTLQGYILSSFFYGYVVTQIPFGILSKRYGARLFLGVGMLINSVFALFVPMAAEGGYWWLILIRFIQGLGEGPIVPCSHAMLAKWIPPNERSRMGAAVYAGAQFGTVISMPLSGLLSAYGPAGGWPSIFYVFGIIGTVWSLAFLFLVSEDPEKCKRIKENEKKYILSSLWGATGLASSPPIPWTKILCSMPFWAIMIAHMGQNYGYETLMTELPTFMRQVLHFSIKDNGFVSALPYLCMWLFSMFISVVADWMLSSGRFNHTQVRKIINSIVDADWMLSSGRFNHTQVRKIINSIVDADWMLSSGRFNHTQVRKIINSIGEYHFFYSLLTSLFISVVADWMLSSGRFNHTQVRKIINSIGEYGPAIGLFIAANTGCNPAATVAVLAIGVGLNGGIYSGFKVNHLDISPRFAGILMAFTNCSANLTGLLAPIIAGYIIEGRPTQAQWRIVFYIAAGVYIFCATFYNVFGSGVRQVWDNPADDEANAKKAAAKKSAKQGKKATNLNQAESAQ